MQEPLKRYPANAEPSLRGQEFSMLIALLLDFATRRDRGRPSAWVLDLDLTDRSAHAAPLPRTND